MLHHERESDAFGLLILRQDIQPNDAQHNNINYNGTQHNNNIHHCDTQHNNNIHHCDTQHNNKKHGTLHNDVQHNN
jgi:hypothetical protein